MLTAEQVEDLRRRMVHHTDVHDMAVCVLSSREVQELLAYVYRWEEIKTSIGEHKYQGGLLKDIELFENKTYEERAFKKKA